MMKSFIREFTALVQGDSTTVVAEKALRSADKALAAQVANLEGDKIEFEEKLESALLNQKKARYNYGQPITNRTEYVNNLVVAKNAVTDAESELEEHNALITFLKGEHELINSTDAKASTK